MFSVTKNYLERIFECFLLQRIGSERNSEVFFPSKNDSEMEFRAFFSLENKKKSEVFLIQNSLERNSEGVSLLRNGSERISDVFLFHKTGGIAMELPSVPPCSVLRGIIFLLENGNPSSIFF